MAVNCSFDGMKVRLRLCFDGFVCKLSLYDSRFTGLKTCKKSETMPQYQSAQEQQNHSITGQQNVDNDCSDDIVVVMPRLTRAAMSSYLMCRHISCAYTLSSGSAGGRKDAYADGGVTEAVIDTPGCVVICFVLAAV